MSYFATQLKPRPLEPPHGLALWPEPSGWTLCWAEPPAGVTATLVLHGAAEPLAEIARVAAHTRCWVVAPEGGPLVSVAWLRGTEIGPPTAPLLLPIPQRGASASEQPLPRLCPLCRGALVCDERLWQCTGRCGARWLEQAGTLLDVAALPFGICGCCAQPRPLIRGDNRVALCPATSTIHLLRADGTVVMAHTLPHGTYVCCVPAMPLLRVADSIVCSARPEQRHIWDGATWTLAAHQPAAAEILASIDAALRSNSAKIGTFGLFDV